MASNVALTSTGSGAPPDRHTLSDLRSSDFAALWLAMAPNSVGTPGMIVGLALAISCIVSSSTKRGRMTISAPSEMPRCMMPVMANT